MTILPFATTEAGLRPARHRILLEDVEVMADIGFHDFEVGSPQRLFISVDVTLDLAHWPHDDSRASAWDYDFIREEILARVAARRYNLQETLAGEIFALIAARPGVVALTVTSRKPDVYPDTRAVGVMLSSH